VVVGGQRDERGVVSAASYEARKFGVHSAMPLRTAAKLCPHAIFLDGHPDLYRESSRQARQVLENFSPAVEMASIDEAYMDMTGTEKLLGPPLKSAHKLHQQMKAQTGLNCSIGIGISRLMAKICSDQAKPNGVLYVLPGQEQSFLAPLDVGKIPGVGKVTKARLNQLGILRVGDLLRVDESFLQGQFGKWGVTRGRRRRLV
jgi:DNA polymerase-4